jgi:transcription factor TFIIIB component B''
MKAERSKKMQEKRSEKRSIKSSPSSSEKPASEGMKSNESSGNKLTLFSQDEINLHAPKIIMKDGKVTIEDRNMAPFEPEAQRLMIVDHNKPKHLTSMSFRTRNHTEKWTPEETEKFFKSIEIFGSDFSMIAKLFPSRNRNQIKNKYRKEEKENPDALENAFKKHKLTGNKGIKERIKNFSPGFIQALPSEDAKNGTVDLNRNLSNSSIDSIDEVMQFFKD